MRVASAVIVIVAGFVSVTIVFVLEIFVVVAFWFYFKSWTEHGYSSKNNGESIDCIRGEQEAKAQDILFRRKPSRK